MANKNIKPPNTFLYMDEDKRRECAKKGGLKSAENGRKRKAMKETLETLLEMSLKKGAKSSVEDIKSFADIKGKNISIEESLMVILVNKALHGDISAITMIRDTIGEKPVEKVVTTQITTEKIAEIENIINQTTNGKTEDN